MNWHTITIRYFLMGMIPMAFVFFAMIHCKEDSFEKTLESIYHQGNSYCPTDAPLNFQAQCEDPASIELTWDSMENADSYMIFRSTSMEGPFEPIGTVTETHFSDTRLTGGKDSYYYSIRANRDACKQSASSEPIQGYRCHEWQTLPVNNINWQGFPVFSKIRLDSTHRPHVLYKLMLGSDENNMMGTSDAIYYTRKNEDQWQESIALSTETHIRINYAMFELDSSDNIHAVYDVTNHDGSTYVKYVFFDGTTASYQSFENGLFPWLCLDSSDQPHITFQNSVSKGIHYVYFNGTTWESVETVYNTGVEPKIALDSSDQPYISFDIAMEACFFYLATKPGGSWDIELVTENACDVSLAIDEQDYPHAAYFDKAMEDLVHVKYTGSEWLFATVDRLGFVGIAPSLRIDESGNWGISYFDFSNLKFKYAYEDWTGIHIETVDQTTVIASYFWDIGHASCLDLDDQGKPHISYYYFNGQSVFGIKYASQSPQGWNIEKIGDSGNSITYTEFFMDEEENLYIEYYDSLNESIKIAVGESRTPTEENPASYRWTFHHVDTMKASYNFSYDMLRTNDGKFHAFNWDYTEHTMKQTTFDGSVWSETLWELGDAFPDSYHFMVTANSKDQFHAFLGEDSQTALLPTTPLYHIYNTSGTWEIEETAFTGVINGMVCDSEDTLHIVYIEDNPPNLQYAAYQDNSWTFERVDSISWSAALEINERDELYSVYIKYVDGNTMKFMLAYRDETGWHTDQLGLLTGQELSYVMNHSIAFDQNGWVHVSYYNPMLQSIQHGLWNRNQWLEETVVIGANVGNVNNILISPANQPIVLHYDKVEDDMFLSFGLTE